MDDLNTSELKKVCTDLVSASHGVVSWKWDSRFNAALAEFPKEKQDSVRAILDPYLSATWDSSSIRKAPDVVKRIAKDFGGLRSGQLLFFSDPNRDVCIFGAWWPWGDGKSISIRVAPYDSSLSNSAHAELTGLFKGWFGL